MNAGDPRDPTLGTPAQAHPDDEDSHFLLRSLEDLERERAAGDIDEHDYRVLNDDYTARAADALRGQSRAALATSPRPDRATRPRWTPVVVMGGVIAFAAVAAFAVTRIAGQRAPGETITGGFPSTRQSEVEALLAEARGGLGTSPVAVLKALDKVLKIDPANPEALAYRGWILYQAGLYDEALVSLDRAVGVAPSYPDARVFRGVVRFRAKGDAVGGAADLRVFLRIAPDHPMAGLVNETLTAAEEDIKAAPST